MPRNIPASEETIKVLDLGGGIYGGPSDGCDGEAHRIGSYGMVYSSR